MISREWIQQAVHDIPLVKRFYYFDEMPSTSDWAKEFVRKNGATGDLHGTLILARHQTVGRGRHGRQWHDVPGKSLMFSLILDLQRVWGQMNPGPLDPGENESRELSHLAMIVLIACCDGIRAATGIDVQSKYPNDIMIQGRKAGGILIETSRCGQNRLFVIGIGINVGHDHSELPSDARVPPTSLQIETAGQVEAHQVLGEILQVLELHIKSLSGKQAAERMSLLCETIGKCISVSTASETVYGTAIGLDCDGALLLRLAAGPTIRVTSGEVLHLHGKIEEVP